MNLEAMFNADQMAQGRSVQQTQVQATVYCLEVGLGLWGEARDFLARLALTDSSLRWHEGRGWVTRRFDVVGSPESLHAIQTAVARFKHQTQRAA